MNMFEVLKHLLNGQNQFASGGLLLMVLGSIGVFVRGLPEQLWSWLVHQTTMRITVKDDDDSFVWVKEWFLEQEFLKRVRRVDLDTSLRGAEMALIPAPGRHFFWHAGLPFWVWFYRSEDTKGRSQRRIESLTFRTIGSIRQAIPIDSYRLLAAHAVGVSSGSLWMDELASPGRTAARYSRAGILSRRQVSTMERIAATRGPAFS